MLGFNDLKSQPYGRKSVTKGSINASDCSKLLQEFPSSLKSLVEETLVAKHLFWKAPKASSLMLVVALQGWTRRRKIPN